MLFLNVSRRCAAPESSRDIYLLFYRPKKHKTCKRINNQGDRLRTIHMRHWILRFTYSGRRRTYNDESHTVLKSISGPLVDDNDDDEISLFVQDQIEIWEPKSTPFRVVICNTGTVPICPSWMIEFKGQKFRPTRILKLLWSHAHELTQNVVTCI